MASPLIKLLALASLPALGAAQTAITVNASTTYQTIDGFGFSQAFGRALEFMNAPADTRTAALDLLFSTTMGAGFSILRNRIGSGNWTGDSILLTSPGSPSGTPNYVWDGIDRGQLWLTQQAVSYGVKNIYVNAWSAPGFMKTSGDEATPGYLCGTTGHTCTSGDWKQAYANFLVQYVKFYAQEGITVTHLGPYNEPDYEVTYSQMQISSDAHEAIELMPALQSAIQAAGLSAKIVCCDFLGWGSTAAAAPYLVSGGATSRMGVLSSHTYSTGASYTIGSTGLPKWVTEAGPLSYAFSTTWYASGAPNEGLTWAGTLARGMVDAQLSAYVFWQGFQLKQSQSAGHLVDAIDGITPTASGIFWAFAMWSRHIRPGAVRLATSGTLAGTSVGAFRNTDGSVVVVLTNLGGSPETAAIGFSGFTPGAVSAWQTSQGSTFASTAASLSGGTVTVSVPARGVVTLKLTVGGGSSGTTTAGTTSTSTTTAQPTSTSAGGCTAGVWGQCGGFDYKGCTVCPSGSTCQFANYWYSQCLPA